MRVIPCPCRFTGDCKNIFHIYFEVHAPNSRGTVTEMQHSKITAKLYTVRCRTLWTGSASWSHEPCTALPMTTTPYGGRVEICIGTATHLRCYIITFSHTLKSGNWFHNSCRRQVSHWNCLHLRCVGGMHQPDCSHHAPWRCIMGAIAQWSGDGHGPDGGCTYMYTRIYTDQEKWSVNHITYIVVYTLHGLQFVTYCDVILCYSLLQ